MDKGTFRGTKKVSYIDFKCPDCGSTWTEKIEEKPERCFIVAATLDSPYHPKLNILRKFRDETMKTSPTGKSLVHLYYATSPHLASVISSSENLKIILRKLLIEPVIEFLENRQRNKERKRE